MTRLLIAMDYDLTYTADPAGWDHVIAYLRSRGHEFVCVTGRTEPPRPEEPAIPMRVVCCRDGEHKSRAAAREGFAVDVWIDDSPGSIEPSRLLEFDTL